MTAAIRPAQPRDIAGLKKIEESADSLLIDLLRPARWDPAPAGATRVSMPGFVLVTSETIDGEAAGFVHIIEMGGGAHLEQLSVLPNHGRRGLGRALVEAAKSEAKHRAYSVMTLRTYADVPWNAPFYSTCGFVETEPDTEFHRGLVQLEAAIGLERYGRRIHMTARLKPAPRA